MKKKVGLIQMNSQLDYQVNLKKIRSFAPSIRAAQIEWLFLPECFYSYGRPGVQTPYVVEKTNEHFQEIQKLSKDLGVYLVGGSAVSREGEQVYNRSYLFSPQGELVSYYDKRHLFACDLSDIGRDGGLQKTYREDLHYTAGKKESLLTIEGWKVALSICFDLRFAEDYRSYFRQGSHILVVPSAFTESTGKAHWETLLRARAIENQSYVIATGQWGEHNGANRTYGHSMVVDPWGEVLINALEGEGFFAVELDMGVIETVRHRMNVS